MQLPINTKFVMTLSAIVLAILGVSTSFAPDWICGLFGVVPNHSFLLLVQLLGATYYAFAMLNWMAKGSIIGGIYNRPITVANFTHFLIGGLALAKGLMNKHDLPLAVWGLTAVYLAFFLVFGVMLSRHPVAKEAIEMI